MRWIIGGVALLATTLSLAENNNLNPNTINNRAAENCSRHTNFYLRQACEEKQHAAEINRAPQPDTPAQNQTTPPVIEPMPAWQQALQPKNSTVPTIEGKDSKSSTSESTTSEPMPAWQQALQPPAPPPIASSTPPVKTP